MDAHRRDFLFSCSALAVAALLPEFATATSAYTNRLPIVQGITDSNSTSLLIVHPQNRSFEISITDEFGRDVPFSVVDTYVIPGSQFNHTEVAVLNLVLGVNYRLSVHAPSGRVFDERVFRALDMSQSRCRFAVVSCMADSLVKPGTPTWQALYKEQPEFVIFNGDTVYADFQNPYSDAEGYGRRYAEARLALPWYYIPKLIPTFANWDDHDFGLNNGDRTFAMSGFTRELFRTFWGRRFTQNCRRGFGVGSVISAFGQRFFLMDCRSWRDPVRTGGYHWGSEQRDWLFSELKKSDEPAWIVNGSRFFSGLESYASDHEKDFGAFIGELGKIAAPVCFVSGDIHVSEIMKIEPDALGYDTYEYTSSSIHSSGDPKPRVPWANPRRVFADGRFNFMMFESHVDAAWSIGSRCVVAGNETAFAHSAIISR
jgi:phosphodiesterase/alkaline phosphatase D-like protein